MVLVSGLSIRVWMRVMVALMVSVSSSSSACSCFLVGTLFVGNTGLLCI